MKKNLLLFLSLALIICFSACNKKQKPVFDLESPGSELIAVYDDSSPNIVYYYKLDKNGNKTDEKIGESYFYENKQVYMGGGSKDGEKDGEWRAFYKDGSIWVEAFYISGKEHGAYNVYRENGNPYYKGHYNNGICDGTWSFYDENGKETKKIKADENTIACQDCPKCRKLK
jgi:antitoxin component YwqK of YwqJK toxin-antitoxin module